MTIPTEPIGSISRSPMLIAAATQNSAGGPQLEAMREDAVRETIARFEATGAPAFTDGRRRMYPHFRTCRVHGAAPTRALLKEAA